MANKVSVELGLNVTGYQQGLNDAIDSTQKYESELRKVKESTINANKELRQSSKQAKDLAATFALLDEEAKQSSFGREIQRQMQEAIEKAAVLKDVVSDTMETINNKASDTYGLDAFMEGFEVVGGIATSVASGIAAVTGSQEDLNRALAIFGTVQSTANTITKIYNTLLPQSNLMLKISDMQTRALAKAKQLETAATVKSTVAQKAFNLVAKANPYVLIATAVIALGAALWGLTKAMAGPTEKEKELEEQTKKANEALQKQQETVMNAGQASYAAASRISHLQTAYKNANDEFSKTAILKEAAAQFKKLGIECNSLADAQRILVNQGGKVAEYLRLQGDIAAIAALRMEAFKKSYKAIFENNNDVNYASLLAGMNAEVRGLDNMLDQMQARAAKLGSELKIKDNTFGSSKSSKKDDKQEERKAAKDSYTALKQEYEKYKKDVEDGFIIKPRANFDSFEADFADYEKRIKEKEIQIGIAKPDPKDIPGTEAWYKENIKNLEEKKARLPIDAVLERDEIDKQIDAINTKLKLSVGIDVEENKDLGNALTGKFEKSMKGYSDAISAIESKLQSMDYTNLDEAGQQMWDNMIQLLLQYKAELGGLQNLYENQLMTPAQKLDKQINAVASSVKSLGSVFTSVGAIAENEGFNIAGIIAQAIAELTLSWAEAMKNDKLKALGPIEWAAVGLSSVATLMSMISAIKSAQGYREGGIIGGHSYYGDKILARLNSRELVLNEDQQEDAWKMMENNAGASVSNVRVTGVIRGKDIVLVQQNVAKELSKTGKNITFG